MSSNLTQRSSGTAEKRGSPVTSAFGGGGADVGTCRAIL